MPSAQTAITGPKGIACPQCNAVPGQTITLDVISTRNPCPGVRVRYRKCSSCGHRFRTREVIVDGPKFANPK
jgi:transcriptional regulator NrdR family protein